MGDTDRRKWFVRPDYEQDYCLILTEGERITEADTTFGPYDTQDEANLMGQAIQAEYEQHLLFHALVDHIAKLEVRVTQLEECIRKFQEV